MEDGACGEASEVYPAHNKTDLTLWELLTIVPCALWPPPQNSGLQGPKKQDFSHSGLQK